MKDSQYREQQKKFKQFLTEDVKTEMAISPNDVKVFKSQNYNSAKISNRVEKLIDETLVYLNSGKKFKKSQYLVATSASQNVINMSFVFNKDTVSADSDLNNLLTIISRVEYYRGKDNDFKKNDPREYSAWNKIKSILLDKYEKSGWSDLRLSVGNRLNDYNLYVSLIK